jgi:hypothetical protein
MFRASSKSKRKWLVCLTAGLLLFTQLAMAAQACMLAKAGPAPSLGQAMATAGCEGMPPMDQRVCVAHCIAGDQAAASLDHQFHLVLPPPSIGSARFSLHGTEAPVAHVSGLPLPAGPPLRVIFCSYQT